MSKPLLQVKNLKKYFAKTGGVFSRKIGEIKAVDGISFTVNEGEVFGIVGESGCGKSTAAKTILRLLEPTDGEVIFEDQDITKLSQEKMRQLRGTCNLFFRIHMLL